MITLERKDFLIQCAKARKSLEETLPCVINMNNNLWTIDETHESYPHTNFSATSSEQIILCGSMAAVDRIQQEFISKQQGD